MGSDQEPAWCVTEVCCDKAEVIFVEFGGMWWFRLSSVVRDELLVGVWRRITSSNHVKFRMEKLFPSRNVHSSADTHTLRIPRSCSKTLGQDHSHMQVPLHGFPEGLCYSESQTSFKPGPNNTSLSAKLRLFCPLSLSVNIAHACVYKCRGAGQGGCAELLHW